MAIVITKQPQNYRGPVGLAPTFSVEAQGEGLNYQWKYSWDKGANWSNSNRETATNAELIFTDVADYHNGYLFRCDITDAGGYTLSSDAATLTIDESAPFLIEPDSLSAIGDAIRNKTGGADALTPAQMAEAVATLQLGIDTNDATAAAAQILSGYTAYAKGAKVTGSIATKTSSDLTASGATVTVPVGYYASQTSKSVTSATQATPSITVDSAGKITASATQSAGYVVAGTKSATKQLTVQEGKAVTPTAAEQTAVEAGVFTTGPVKVEAVPTETKTVTPTGATQNIIPTSGKFLSKVMLNAADWYSMFSKLSIFSWTPASQSSLYTLQISHSLGVVPDGYVCFAKGITASGKTHDEFVYFADKSMGSTGKGEGIAITHSHSSNGYAGKIVNLSDWRANNTATTICLSVGGIAAYTGETYTFIVYKRR